MATANKHTASQLHHKAAAHQRPPPHHHLEAAHHHEMGEHRAGQEALQAAHPAR